MYPSVTYMENLIKLLGKFSKYELLNNLIPGVTLDCYVKARFATPDLQEVFAQYNSQYPYEPTVLYTFEHSHDRWLIIDDTVYHFGASLKDLGKRWFSVDIITEHSADELISRINS